MRILKTFARIYVSDVDAAVAAARAAGAMSGEPCRFSLDDTGVDIAVVGEMVIVAGSESALSPFRSTDVTWLVEDLDASLHDLETVIHDVVRPPRAVPSGRNATVRLGGFQVELVEWNSPPDSSTI